MPARADNPSAPSSSVTSPLTGGELLGGREIVLGVSGGIAAYKSADLASRLVQRGAHLSVVMTQAATRFIGPATFEALTGRAVSVDLWSPREHFQGEHIGVARRAELFVIAPATADLLAKLAQGHADDVLTAAVLVATCPLLVAPAMNAQMWDKPAVQRNVDQLRADGARVVDPGAGWLSCGEVGMGRMAEPATILLAIEMLFQETYSHIPSGGDPATSATRHDPCGS